MTYNDGYLFAWIHQKNRANSLQAELKKLRKELKKLREENRRLKKEIEKLKGRSQHG